ncbi:biotin--[acetyl-CoA-carboxylase] ligase [Cohnella sp. CIP 111063]|uniref:biotin--[acetyl-CoA-carboxylase] ligase n=1 Tax=unclassified Cohnella TaxID=2636738 RepID=UPI000B8BF79C|nr:MULTISPECIES: biotin--[acetyl-CoA-carboxylase] ligase [unclassified Cohnella]OXS61162.1 biotin--[acetyl-CoA-carboxylase] ligase [Cohnella sp. CIP 111063]PRX73719.1 BirA family biotin operon repressor/biotin-[acetyl-CoA-carboxylase] ligase [Cohnella sp. SGD-V74]
MSKANLLSLLEEREGQYVSGEEISRALNVSRTAVWKQVRKLEADGYRIEAVPRLGYRLTAKPSRLTLQELLPKLRTTSFGRRLTLLDVTDSTQNELRKLAEQGAAEGTLVIAEQQTSGRGRMGRSWVSPFGKGIWMSLLLRPPVPLPLTPQLTLLAAVALSRAISQQLPELDIGIKWPNDLLVGGKKISGILLESAAEDERLNYVVVGLGVSANLEAGDYPEELLDKAVSLKMASGETVNRSALIASVLEQFEQLYKLYLEQGFAPIRTLWEARSVTLGKRTELYTPQGKVVGVPLGLDEMGGLRVELEDGSLHTVYSAEVGASG